MGEQRTFAELAWSAKKKTTRREQFLAEMNAVVPWKDLVGVVAPHYPVAGGGRRPMPLERMLRIYFVQQWFDLSDPAAEDLPKLPGIVAHVVGIDAVHRRLHDDRRRAMAGACRAAIAQASQQLPRRREALVLTVWRTFNVGFVPEAGAQFDAACAGDVRQAAEQKSTAHGVSK